MIEDYYVILGVPRGASRAKIKNAYRSMAKRYHPDSMGHHCDERKFRQVQEAYDTLGHDDRRAAYDHRLHEDHRYQDLPGRSRSRQGAATHRPAEPLRPRHGAGGAFSAPAAGRMRLAKGGQKDLRFEMILEPAEAFHGGLFPMRIPVLVACRHCAATGIVAPYVCPRCLGQGWIRDRQRLMISVPPRIEDGTTAALDLDDVGLRGIRLHLHIRIAADPLF
jgi:molecular chaperone DnaJ